MNGLSTLHSQLNHTLARIDAGETLGVRLGPLKKVVGPGIGMGVGAAAMVYNVTQAPTPTLKKKTLIRDGIVLLSVGLSSFLIGRHFIKNPEFAGEIIESVSAQWKKLWNRGKEAAAKGVESHGHHHHHHHGHGAEVFSHESETLLSRVRKLFEPSTHDHGPEGALKLTLLAITPIFGGALGGLLADAINGEDVRHTGAMKLKEGLFQFLGNITMCTVAILAMSAVGKKAVTMMWEAIPAIRTPLRNQMAKSLEKLSQQAAGDLRRVPTPLTETIERGLLLLEKGKGPEFVHEVEHFLKHQFSDTWNTIGKPAWEKLEPTLKEQLNGEKPNKGAILKAIQGFYSDMSAGDLRQLVETGRSIESRSLATGVQDIASRESEDALYGLAKVKAENQGKLIGIVGGVIGGVLGGAWISNLLNKALTQWFNLPEGHESTGFFGRGHHHDHHPTTQTPHMEDGGLLAGKIGDRGIHWYDGILHLDDWPSAMYMAGVEAVESFIQVLYGISGFLTGTAGTSYQSEPESAQKATPQNKIVMPSTSFRPLGGSASGRFGQRPDIYAFLAQAQQHHQG